jgi:hypothetical protein
MGLSAPALSGFAPAQFIGAAGILPALQSPYPPSLGTYTIDAHCSWIRIDCGLALID